jgi:hypothetical protein
VANLETDAIERTLVAALGSEAEFATTIDMLVGRLLSALPGYSARLNDGVIFEYSRITERQAEASGILILINQTVVPVRVTFVLDSAKERLVAGTVQVGDVGTAVAYGSQEHQKLAKAILANPKRAFDWKKTFHRNSSGWHSEEAQEGNETNGL